MSAPLIWIILPGLLAALLFLTRRSAQLTIALGVAFSLLLWVAASLLPIGSVVGLGENALKVGERLAFLGREFVLSDVERPFLALLYFFLTVWLIGAWFARPSELFVPFSFVMVALLIAALAVEPFLYAALLIEICILIAIPLLSPPNQPPGRGVFRFLTFQTMAMPFILLAGWFLAGLEVSPGQSDLVLRAGILIGLGFAFLLAVVPFHSWVPMLAEEAHPYVVAFILFMLPGMVSVFGLGFLDRFIWLRDSVALYQGMRVVGALMVIVGGFWAAVEKNMGRMMGFTAVADTGLGLLAVGIGSPDGLLLYFWLSWVRLFSFVPWAAALSQIKQEANGRLDLAALRGFGHQHPYLSGLTLLAHFSLVGAPFLSGFAARYALWGQVSALDAVLAGVALLGNIGLLVAALRSLNALFVPLPEQEYPSLETPAAIFSRQGELVPERVLNWFLMGFMALLMAWIGLFPQVYLPWLERVLGMFVQIGR